MDGEWGWRVSAGEHRTWRPACSAKAQRARRSADLAQNVQLHQPVHLGAMGSGKGKGASDGRGRGVRRATAQHPRPHGSGSRPASR